jgi:T-complex protein 1 subunit theta
LATTTVETKELKSKEVLTRGAASAISSKQFGFEDFLAPLVAEACLAVMPANPAAFNVDNVRIVKVLGANVRDSEVIKGMVIPHDTIGNITSHHIMSSLLPWNEVSLTWCPMTERSIGTIKKVKDAKVAVFACSIQCTDTETKGTILLESANDLLKYNVGEEKEIEKIIRDIYDSGVRVVITGGTVDDMAAHFLQKYGLMTLKVTSKHDLRRIAKACKARAMMTLVIILLFHPPTNVWYHMVLVI